MPGLSSFRPQQRVECLLSNMHTATRLPLKRKPRPTKSSIDSFGAPSSANPGKAHFITMHVLAFSNLTKLFSLRPPAFSLVFGAFPSLPPFLKLALPARRVRISPRATFSRTSLHVPA
ncbi:hypothetical protein B0H13DRAFT_2317976 [Mycena leptocephala]|nr:hypothetical protein B0H13DRAFT_2317976 [Mycena leptocephala]